MKSLMRNVSQVFVQYPYFKIECSCSDVNQNMENITLKEELNKCLTEWVDDEYNRGTG